MTVKQQNEKVSIEVIVPEGLDEATETQIRSDLLEMAANSKLNYDMRVMYPLKT